MNITRKVILSPCRNVLLPQGIRSAHWNKDWMPGPYPQTAEERAAAAKKYGLLPEEYEPYPDDGMGRGDYPKLKNISVDSRDPFYSYDFPEHRKNFGEPMHAFSDTNGEDRCDYNIDEKIRFSKSSMLIAFLSVMSGGVAITYFCKNRGINASRPVLARHYPSDGVHYKY